MIGHFASLAIAITMSAALIFLPAGRQKMPMILTSAFIAAVIFLLYGLKQTEALSDYADALKITGLVIAAFLSSLLVGFVIRKIHGSRHEGCRPIPRAMFIDALIGGPVIAALPLVVPPELGEKLLMGGSVLSIVPIAVIVMARRRSRYEY